MNTKKIESTRQKPMLLCRIDYQQRYLGRHKGKRMVSSINGLRKLDFQCRRIELVTYLTLDINMDFNTD